MPLHALNDQHLDHDLATIRIKNLRLRTYIGIKEEEIRNRQDVVINAVIRYRADRAVKFNHIDQALNYRTITKHRHRPCRRESLPAARAHDAGGARYHHVL